MKRAFAALVLGTALLAPALSVAGEPKDAKQTPPAVQPAKEPAGETKQPETKKDDKREKTKADAVEARNAREVERTPRVKPERERTPGGFRR